MYLQAQPGGSLENEAGIEFGAGRMSVAAALATGIGGPERAESVGAALAIGAGGLHPLESVQTRPDPSVLRQVPAVPPQVYSHAPPFSGGAAGSFGPGAASKGAQVQVRPEIMQLSSLLGEVTRHLVYKAGKCRAGRIFGIPCFNLSLSKPQ